ncbi:MAG TPA: carboxypeptidase-like regulatory domain-containing protein, partial [Cyclobacteriaceae bacterium]|nr:carboxypeptidase-like regulatory domain-containing protein [Cyclobacteriaceae bacterium]
MAKHFTLLKILSVFPTLLIILVMGSLSVMGQSRMVTGKIISSEDGLEIPGANVLVKDTNIGTSTDIYGMYAIEVPTGSSVLIFSFIGYQTQEVEIGSRSVLHITLTPEAGQLGEVVVTALGIRREEISLGYSIGRIGGDELNRVVQENVLNGMAGKVAGVTVSSTGGTGSSVSMVIRGATSLSSDNQPLFVVDGVPIANTLNNVSQIGSDNRVDYGNAISGLNPDDIADITILKGPSAAALYGSRAGNGVVLITTKTG